jgi:hypothetical protein
MRQLCVLCVIALGFSATGCGDGDDSSDPSDPTRAQSSGTITKDAFIEKGDELCAEFRDAEAELQAQYEDATDFDEAAALTRELAAEAEDIVDGLEALGTPDEGAELVERYIEGSREQIVLLNRIADSTEDGDSSEVEALRESGQEVGARLQGIAQGYGFEVCGSQDE